MIVTEVLDADLRHWVSGVRLFRVSDGTHFIVDADLAEYPGGGPVTFVRRSTAVLYCDSGGVVADLTVDHLFPPGTTAEDAITQLGHTLEA